MHQLSISGFFLENLISGHQNLSHCPRLHQHNINVSLHGLDGLMVWVAGVILMLLTSISIFVVLCCEKPERNGALLW
jgi:hypothetical protein